MNTLSWLLYFADVSERLRMDAGLMAMVIGLVLGIAFIGYAIAKVISDSETDDKLRTDSARMANAIGKFLRWPSVGLFLALLAAANFLPSRQTIYYIAASEAGDVVIKSQEAKEIYDLLRGRIKAVLAAPVPGGRQ